MNILANLSLGTAALAQSTTLKAGGVAPVAVTFSQAPGAGTTVELALSAQSSSPAVLAYLSEWNADNGTTFTGFIDLTDTRLIAFLQGKAAQTLDAELVVTNASGRQPFPNFKLVVQQPILSGPASSEGGPVYLTQYAAHGNMRVTAAGLELQDTVTGVWRRLSFADGQLTFTEL